MDQNENYILSLLAKDQKLLNFPDCVHLTELGRCGILRVRECRGADCSFCQSAAEHQEARDSWNRRLNALSEEEQRKIAESYYDGRMPWKGLTA
ncbi:MAG: hypothetical protein LBT36_03760 [Oscillospiraceae bacterium]|jgi:hypothetical protein|nr:hypothetical protein [Oscillospiraceae bacterium]